LACANAKYEFVIVDAGAFGRQSDGGIFKNSAFGSAFERQEVPLPDPIPLPNTDYPEMPYVFVADEAFGLKTNMMRPFPGRDLNIADEAMVKERRIFNYRLSRARRIIENTFGILANRFVARKLKFCSISHLKITN
jgi:hypothetical protein